MKIKIFVIIFIAAAAFFSFNTYTNHLKINRQQRILNNKKKGWSSLNTALENKLSGFKGQVGLVVEDLDTGWVIAFNENTLFPSASLVKVPILLSYFFAEEEGKVRLKDTIRLRSSEKTGGSKVLGNFPAGSQFVVEELFDPMITVSDNSATNVLIDLLGFDALNNYFKKMGLRNTNIARNMLDFKSRKAGIENYTTASDMAYVLKKLYRKQFLSKEVSEKCLVLLNQQEINDRIPRYLPKGEASVAHKTGLERSICHDVGIVYTEKGDFIICVLVKHNYKLSKPAKKLISDIALSVYNYYKNL